MKIRKVVVTGDNLFLDRHKFLFEAMSTYFEQLECIPSAHFLSEVRLIRKFKELIFQLTRMVAPVKAERFYKNAQNFIVRSQQTEAKLRQLEYTPDLVFHIFNLCCPVWDKFDIPYAMYLDYTMSLIIRNWLPGAPFNNTRELTEWLNCERKAYQQASYLFTMSNVVKSSLTDDYGIEPEKIAVVGCCGDVKQLYEAEKTFGSYQILFNGSEFERKGGDLVLAAFKQVKQALPRAKLVMIGKKLPTQSEGVSSLGYISSPTQRQDLFLNTDLVVAPARCEPYGIFLIEAMNFGVPCIVSASGGMPEIVDDGVNGVVIAQPTPEIIADKIIGLLRDQNKLKIMSQNARQKVKNNLNCHNVAARISQVLLTS